MIFSGYWILQFGGTKIVTLQHLVELMDQDISFYASTLAD
jgi:hypothetical protein